MAKALSLMAFDAEGVKIPDVKREITTRAEWKKWFGMYRLAATQKGSIFLWGVYASGGMSATPIRLR